MVCVMRQASICPSWIQMIFLSRECWKRHMIWQKKIRQILWHIKSDQYHTEKKQFVSADWVIHENEIPPYHPFNHRQMTGNVFKVFVGWAWDKLFLKEFVDKHHLTFQEQRTSNDLLFCVQCSSSGKKNIRCTDGSCSSSARDAKDSLSKQESIPGTASTMH